jgi:simple sugar transport system permease protein
MMNSVANYLCQFFVVGPLSAGSTIPRTKEVAVRFLQILPPTRLNIGIFFVFAILAYIIWLTNKTTFGYELKTVGQNPMHAKFAGISPAKVGLKAMLLSGALAGFSGCIEILGNYGYFLNEFHLGIGSRGLLVALLVNCNLWLLPVSAFFISALSSGSLTLQASTSVPKSLADALTALFILLVTMETLFLHKRRKKAPAAQLAEARQEEVNQEQMEIRTTAAEDTERQKEKALAQEIVKADARAPQNETKEEHNNG